MSVVRTLMDKFWNPDVWLPPNVTWADLEPNDKIAYADHRHLAIPLPFALVLLGVRYVLERLVKIVWSERLFVRYFSPTIFMLCTVCLIGIGFLLLEFLLASRIQNQRRHLLMLFWRERICRTEKLSTSRWALYLYVWKTKLKYM
jgi:hypothetical protein